MSNNLDLLKQVGEYFTVKTLKSIVAKEKGVVNENDIDILSWDFETISGKGDNYLSVVNRVHVKSKVNNETLDTKIIVKSLPKNLFRRKLLRSSEYFYNEITFYDKIATKFHSYLTDKKQNQLLSIPRCFAYHYDEENDFIALEDVTCFGYNSVPRQKCLSYEECKYFLETIARFHGISFAYKNEKKEEFNQMASLLNETFFRNDIYEDSFKSFYDNLFRIAKDALAKEYPGSKGERVFNSYQPEVLYKKTVEICARKEVETEVISHGDTWAPNFMVRKNASGKTDVLLLDFQVARCASPVLDVVFFIYQCTDKPVRDEHYERMLEDYYAELAKTMQVLGAEPDKLYPRTVFQNEVKQQSLYGLSFALVNIPLVLVSENDVFDLDSIEEAIDDIGDLDILPNLEKPEDRQRLADVIVHAVEHEYI